MSIFRKKDTEIVDFAQFEHDLEKQWDAWKEVLWGLFVGLVISILMYFFGHVLEGGFAKKIAETFVKIFPFALWAIVLGVIISRKRAKAFIRGVISIIQSSRALEEKFNDLEDNFDRIRSRDNIIAPSAGDFKILSIVEMKKMPGSIERSWNHAFKDMHGNIDNSVRYKASRVHGYCILDWPSVDDMINSPEYLDYLNDNPGPNNIKFLFTPKPKPKHGQGLDIYIKLCRMNKIELRVISLDTWNNWRHDNESLFSGLGDDRKRLVRCGLEIMLKSHMELWSSVPIQSVDPCNPSNRWLARWLCGKDGRSVSDPRARLASPEWEIRERSSQENPTADFCSDLTVLSKFLEIATRRIPAAHKSKNIEDLFEGGLPEEMTNFLRDLPGIDLGGS
jgi:hypothetical protein